MELFSKHNQGLRLSIEVEKRHYVVGDELVIKYVVKNYSRQNIVFINSDRGYKANWIKVYDDEHNALPWERIIVYSLLRYFPKESYVTIAPGKAFIVNIRGILKEENNKIIIDFEDSEIILGEPGKFIIKGGYDCLERWAEEGRQLYGFKNIWTAPLESEEKEILIETE